jgi:hypothetical protein
MRYLKPSSSRARDLLNIQSDKNEYDRSNPNQYIAKVKRTITTGQLKMNCGIDRVAFQRHTDNDNKVKVLSFWVLGHGMDLSVRNSFSSYSSVNQVIFSAHFSYITPAFQIIAQLKSLTTAVFNVDSFQRSFFLEQMDEDFQNLKVPQNPSVVSLDVVVDPTSIHMKTLEKVLQKLFQRAEECLPNVKRLHLQLPIMSVSKDICMRVIHNGWLNLAPQHVAFTVQYFPPTVRILLLSRFNN